MVKTENIIKKIEDNFPKINIVSETWYLYKKYIDRYTNIFVFLWCTLKNLFVVFTI